jgi:hypothetical protein
MSKKKGRCIAHILRISGREEGISSLEKKLCQHQKITLPIGCQFFLSVILQHRQDGKDYTGTLTFTASKPVEVLFGHRLNIDNKTLLNVDMKKFGDLFLVNPIHTSKGQTMKE